MIVIFDTEDLELFGEVDPNLTTYTWQSDGELHIKMRKSASTPKYWQHLLKDKDSYGGQPLGKNEPKMLLKVPVQTWWEKKDEHIDQVEDLAVEERQGDMMQD